MSASRAWPSLSSLRRCQSPGRALCSSSGSRMAEVIGGFQVLTGYGSVKLGGRQVTVSQKLLYRPQVGAPFEEVGGEGVPQGVGEGCGPITHDPADTPLVESPTPVTHE